MTDSLMRAFHLLWPLLALGLTACERLGIEDPAKIAVNKEAEGKAIGAGCRHAGRGLEDCYAKNPKALKAAVFAGWKEMNDYMAQNKIDIVPPLSAAPQADAGQATDTPAKLAEQAPAEKAPPEQGRAAKDGGNKRH